MEDYSAVVDCAVMDYRAADIADYVLGYAAEEDVSDYLPGVD